MVYELEIKEEAKEKILDVFFHYTQNIHLELAQRFIDEVDELLVYIHKHPEHFQIKYKQYREAIFKVFPYVFIYEIVGNIVVVYTLFPAKDDPNKKLLLSHKF